MLLSTPYLAIVPEVRVGVEISICILNSEDRWQLDLLTHPAYRHWAQTMARHFYV